MKRNKIYKSEVFEVIHKTMFDLYEAGVVNKQTMCRFDKKCTSSIYDFKSEKTRPLHKK
ncbi:hypothetical protein L3V83_01645 [Thiotrichales bacterium 19X7-9]|nr:hypothetical protein [Thiotrichales bacterium 19X7-9]